MRRRRRAPAAPQPAARAVAATARGVLPQTEGSILLRRRNAPRRGTAVAAAPAACSRLICGSAPPLFAGDDIAYNVVDMQNFPQGEAADKLQLKLAELEAVISTRLIYTGSGARCAALTPPARPPPPREAACPRAVPAQPRRARRASTPRAASRWLARSCEEREPYDASLRDGFACVCTDPRGELFVLCNV